MKFAEIIRSSPQVRAAFDGVGGFSLWWRVILALHGKPLSKHGNADDLRLVIARGIRFYGYLYATLAGILFVAAFIIGWASLLHAPFWICVLTSASIYLIASTRLAFVGSRNYLSHAQNATPQLVTFFVAIIAFLSCFCGFCAAIAHFTNSGHEFTILTAISILLILGVGSYLLEIVYLVTDRSRAEAK